MRPSAFSLRASARLGVKSVRTYAEEMVRPARLERATSWFVGSCRDLDSQFFVCLARVTRPCYPVFGNRLFTD